MTITAMPTTATTILSTYGLACPCDPRWIAAAHAYEFRDAEPTIRTVMAACRLCSKRAHEDNEALARSYGL